MKNITLTIGFEDFESGKMVYYLNGVKMSYRDFVLYFKYEPINR